MPKYDYEKSGEVQEFEFPLGKAPQEFDGWTRVLIVPIARFKGDGWTRRSTDNGALYNSRLDD